MTDATSDAVALSNEGARLLLNQWVKYRYGVFDERGFKNDPMYPLYWMTPGDGPGTEKITSCAATFNGQTVDTIRTLNKTTTGEICSLQINHETGHPFDSKCIPHADVRSNDDIISSLLSHPSLPNNEYFCDEKTHNKKSPNKHNNLCDGSSVWEVMNRHEDFKNNRYVLNENSSFISIPSVFSVSSLFLILLPQKPYSFFFHLFPIKK